jgi:hypothetical protein
MGPAAWWLVLLFVALAARLTGSQASWELALPALALAALVVGALLTSWWLGRPIPKGSTGAEQAAAFMELPATREWFVLGAVMSGLSLAAGVLVVQPWWHLFSDTDNLARIASVLLPIVALLLAMFLPGALRGPRVELPFPHQRRRTAVFFVFGGLGLFPAASGMLLVWAKALKTGSGSPEVELLVDQRRSLVLFLGVAAFIVVLAIVAFAGYRRALIASGRDYPAIYLLFTGAYFSALIAILFVPAYLAVQDAARAAVNTLIPISNATLEHEWFQRRSDLEAFLGLDVSVVGVFSAAFAVLTPVASSVLATYLTPAARKQGHGDREERPTTT